MAEPQPMPQPPEGMPRPGIAGAGNLLDPAVRAQIRETLHPALHQAGRQAAGQAAEPPAGPAEQPTETAEAATTPAPAPPPPPRPAGLGPFPHGDVDLRFIAPNVPPEPVRPRRHRQARRFYFLTDSADDSTAETATPPLTTPPGPRPG
jgi:hypothetical protein